MRHLLTALAALLLLTGQVYSPAHRARVLQRLGYKLAVVPL